MNEQFNVKKREFFRDSPMSKAGIFVKIAAIIVIILLLIVSANSLMEYSNILKETEAVEQDIDTILILKNKKEPIGSFLFLKIIMRFL